MSLWFVITRTGHSFIIADIDTLSKDIINVTVLQELEEFDQEWNLSDMKESFITTRLKVDNDDPSHQTPLNGIELPNTRVESYLSIDTI